MDHFKLNNLTPQEVEDVDGSVDYATEILRARKKPRIMREYSNLDWIPPLQILWSDYSALLDLLSLTIEKLLYQRT